VPPSGLLALPPHEPIYPVQQRCDPPRCIHAREATGQNERFDTNVDRPPFAQAEPGCGYAVAIAATGYVIVLVVMGDAPAVDRLTSLVRRNAAHW